MRPPHRIIFIVRRPYAFVADLLREDFKANANVGIIVDRRYGERRTRQQPVTVEWRQADRRRRPEEMLAVFIGPITTQLMRPPGSTS